VIEVKAVGVELHGLLPSPRHEPGSVGVGSAWDQ
jgi:hypothetical protein